MANPIVSRTELAVGSVPMTVGGVVKKARSYWRWLPSQALVYSSML